MGFKRKFTRNDVRNKLKYDAVRIEAAIVNRMRRIGEQFVTDARNESTYKDQTGNLRSSIGYFILRGNRVIDWNVYGNATGITAAKKAIAELPRRDYLRIVGVAGMGYASQVESRGLNVITMQSMVAIDELDKQLKRLSKRVDQDFKLDARGTTNRINF